MSLYPHYNCSLVIHKSCCSAAVLQVTVGAAYFYIHSSTARGAELMRDDSHCLVTSWPAPAPGDVILINTGKLPPRWVGKWPPAEAAALWSAVHNPNLEIQSTIKPLKPSKHGHGQVDIYWPCFLYILCWVVDIILLLNCSDKIAMGRFLINWLVNKSNS